jgi:hypothetical protein
VQPLAQFRFDFLQLSAFPLTHRPPQHRELPLSRLATAVREAQKVEGLGFPLATRFSLLDRKAAKLNHARFLGMQFQSELGEALRQFMVKLFGILLVLKGTTKSSAQRTTITSPLAFVFRQCCTQRSNT